MLRILAAAALCIPLAAAARPQIVLLETPGLAQAPLTPVVVIYADRPAIFRAPRANPSPSGYVTARLSPGEHQDLMASVAPEALLQLGASYVSTTSADPPLKVLHLWTASGRYSISVFADTRETRARATLPRELLRALDALGAVSAPGAAPWTPANFEMYVLPKQARGEALPWPQGLPPSGYPAHRLKDSVNWLTVQAKHFPAVAALRPGHALRYADRTWQISYRLPFPNESAWEERSMQHEVGGAPKSAAPRAAAGEPRVVLEYRGGRSGPGNAAGFALYSDRLAIFSAPDRTPSPSGYVSTRLSEKQYGALLEAIAPQDMLRLAGSYDAITATDPVAHLLHVWTGGRRKTVSVTGNPHDPRVPREFQRAHDAISAFSAPAAAWLPASFEVTLSPREHFDRDRPAAWPRGWPGLEQSRIFKNGTHRFSLPASQFGAMKQLLGEGSTAIIEAAGRRWLVAYHLPFPLEATWAW